MANTFDHPLVVLMTATIDPGPESTLSRIDPATRLEDYLRALHFWLTHPDPRIAGVVVCDNSGIDVRPVREFSAESKAERPVEILSFNGNHHPPPMHYGYGELGIIDHAIDHSQLMRSTEYFVKATGRLVFPRLSALLDSLDAGVEVAVDCRRSYSRETGPGIRARTQLMLFRTSFYRQHFLHRREEMFGVCTHIEEFLAIGLEARREEPGVVLRWKVECSPSGIRSSDNGRYDSLDVRLKQTVRAMLRRAVPALWI